MTRLLLLLPVIALVASAPALYVWWRGRRVRALPDDQLLPERLAAENRHATSVTTVSLFMLGLLGGWHLLWTAPLAIVLLFAADYPARRQIYGETWSIGQYLSFWIRWHVASLGFWIALGITPSLIRLAGSRMYVASAAALLVLAFLNLRWSLVLPWLLGARPLTDTALVDAFRPVTERASVPAPSLWVVETNGGFVPNALALPGLKGGGVLFLRTLLDRLPAREIAAIFAHEVGHLEQFTPRVLRWFSLLGWTLVSGAVIYPIAIARLAPGSAGLLHALWPALIVVVLVARTRFMHRLEIDSDRRAAELCGDPEAVASALVRLYAIGRMPRRLDVEAEHWDSHPSLARRVQALRATSRAGGRTPPREPGTFATTRPPGCVTFDIGGIRIVPASSGAPPATALEAGASIPYGDLHELRLDVPRSGAPRLVGRDRTGRVIRLTVREEDAADIQSALDAVDTLFAPDPPAGRVAQALAPVLSCAAAIAALWGGAVSAFVASGLAAFRASAPTMMAAGVGGMTGGIIAWQRSEAAFHAPLLLLVSGAGLVAIAWSRRRHELDVRRRIVAIAAFLILAGGAALSWLTGVLIQPTAWRLHRALAVVPGVAVFPLSLAALLGMAAFTWPSTGGAAIGGAGPQPGRTTGVRLLLTASALLSALVGLFPFAAASPSFVLRAVRDPLIVDAPRLPLVDATFHVERDFELRTVTLAGLSPGGGWLAVSDYGGEDSDSHETRFTLIGPQGERLALAAVELVFADDGHVLVALGSRTGATLELKRLVDGLPTVWSQPLSARHIGGLAVSTARAGWRLLEWTEDGGVIRFEGSIGSSTFSQRRWSVGEGEETPSYWFVGSGDHAVRVGEYELPTVAALLAQPLGARMLDGGYRGLGVVDASGAVRDVSSELRMQCVSPPVGVADVTCTAFDGLDTRIFRVGRQTIPVGIVRGILWLTSEHEDGTLAGALDSEHVLVQPHRGRVVRLPGVEDGGWFEVLHSAGRVAGTRSSGGGTRVEVGKVE